MDATSPPAEGSNPSFEQAFARLEQILELLNAESVPLEQALKLYEEANQLLVASNRRLVEAEQRIEVLTKTRQGDLALDAQGVPVCEPFQPCGASS